MKNEKTVVMSKEEYESVGVDRELFELSHHNLKCIDVINGDIQVTLLFAGIKENI